jgi:hypothetical protein
MKVLVSSLDPDTGERITTERNLAPEEEAELWPPASPVPTRSVTRRQFMLALHVWQLRDTVEALVAQAGGVTAIAWDNTGTFLIDDPMLVSLVSQLDAATNGQFTSDQLQEFFDFAATL